MPPSDTNDNTSDGGLVATQNELFPTKDLNSQRAANYINKVWDIRTSDAEGEGALAFMARCFIQATLPHSDPGKDVSIWHRENGIYTLEIKAARYFDKTQKKEINVGLPSGSIPRLLLVWMTTEAIRTKEPRLMLGSSLSEFMGKLGLIPSGGKRGDITRLKNQSYKLFRSEFTLTQEQKGGVHEKDLKISNERMLFWNPRFPEQESLWESWVNLTPDFFEAITKNPAPMDMRALKALKNSSMALDIYMWLSHRTFYLSKPQRLSWKALEGQIGANYSHEKTLRQNVRKAVNKIRVFWPELNVNFDDPDIITLYPSKSIITPREMRQGKLLFEG